MNIGIILGSTRPGRVGEAVANWVCELASSRRDASYELVDVARYQLPLLDEPVPPALGNYAREHTKIWARKVASFDGYVFVTAEYNHGIPAALKNALDFVYAEWNNKAAGFVSYGSAGGTRAVEQLRLVMAELQIADIRTQVTLSLVSDFENYQVFRPDARKIKAVETMLNQLVAWAGAMKQLRPATSAAAAE
jgi:NAD(P)H-dependent FMN reductase